MHLLESAITSIALSGCAPMISGVMNATVDENAVSEKTAKYFGVNRENITISSIEKSALTTSYKAKYARKIYNCSIYYGQVTCAQVRDENAQDDLDVAKDLGSRVPAQASSDSQAVVAMTPAQAQARLNQLGYPVGSPDGVFGKKSVAELKLFQKARGLSVSGKLDSATVNALQ